MTLHLNVNVCHLSRIEGHGNIRIRVENGEIKEAAWDTVETPRFFEIMLKNKHYTTAGLLAARICGICSISHCLCSIQATENAFDVIIPKTAARLRLLAKHGETLQSHVLHLLFLAAPDFFNASGIIQMLEKRPDVAALATRLKGLANRLCDIIAGRTTHPVAFQVGGVTLVPRKKDLEVLKQDLKQSVLDLHQVADLFSTFALPDFTRETEFVSLKGENDYAFMGQSLISSDGVERSAQEYQSMTNEVVNENNTSKWTRLSRESYAVGALARYNNNGRLLHPEAAGIAARFGLKPVCHNPFMSHVARLAECFHVVYAAMDLIDELLESEVGNTMARVTPKSGHGVSAVEAPRGILFHHYTYDKTGRILEADCVVPTTQNNANIHHDILCLVKQFARTKQMTDEKLEHLSSMLVRSYDPCLSCSVH